jgi:hypothetical protein
MPISTMRTRAGQKWTLACWLFKEDLAVSVEPTNLMLVLQV